MSVLLCIYEANNFLFYFQEEQGIEAVPKQVSFIAALFKSTSGNPAENSTGAG